MSFDKILTCVERGDMSATQALEKLNDRLLSCYNGMASHVGNHSKHLDAHTNQLIDIAKNGMFDVLKIWFEDELNGMGLNTTKSYEEAMKAFDKLQEAKS